MHENTAYVALHFIIKENIKDAQIEILQKGNCFETSVDSKKG